MITKYGIFGETYDRGTLRPVFEQYVAGKSFLDIGSGNGKIVELALQCGARSAAGAEGDPTLFAQSVCREHILYRDFFDLDFSGYEVLFYVLAGSFREQEVWQKIAREATGTVIFFIWPEAFGLKDIVSHYFKHLPALYGNCCLVFRVRADVD